MGTSGPYLSSRYSSLMHCIPINPRRKYLQKMSSFSSSRSLSSAGYARVRCQNSYPVFCKYLNCTSLRTNDSERRRLDLLVTARWTYRKCLRLLAHPGPSMRVLLPSLCASLCGTRVRGSCLHVRGVVVVQDPPEGHHPSARLAEVWLWVELFRNFLLPSPTHLGIVLSTNTPLSLLSLSSLRGACD
ncbi:hypothetical protein BD410DRAFT_79067 [Rickenella mellea]|uniref:Uncharacterized protein n=1 Tax=Rickenella mellea TaxID=50990 RepID=A0A4Y7PLP6_9AGAM|nr:hypothetical protein BD410DRAFT_79067 [Rickenella mellea]